MSHTYKEEFSDAYKKESKYHKCNTHKKGTNKDDGRRQYGRVRRTTFIQRRPFEPSS